MSNRSTLDKMMSRTLDANLRYTALATRLATTAVESAFSVAKEIGSHLAPIVRTASIDQAEKHAEATKTPRPMPAAIVLEGVAGSVAIGFFVVENSLSQEISTPVEVSTLIAPDGQEIQSALRFEPGVITLAAGEQVVARVSAKISRRLVAGERYQGEIRVPGVAGARIPIVLRRKSAEGAAKPIRKRAAASASAREKKSVRPPKKGPRPGRRDSK
jgi:hypothetical protein